MERSIHESAQAEDASNNPSARARRQPSWKIDVQRARTLRGDALEELTDKQREWVWRSLLCGVRLAQATKLAQLSPEETLQALQQVANRHSALMDRRRRKRQQQSKTAHLERNKGRGYEARTGALGAMGRMGKVEQDGRHLTQGNADGEQGVSLQSSER